MEIVKIEPVRIGTKDGRAVGLVDVIYTERCGLFWSKTRRVKRRAFSTSGHLWYWNDAPMKYLCGGTQVIHAHVTELLAGETIHIGATRQDDQF